MKNKEFVASIVNNLKANTKDGHISRRFILSRGRIKARYLMSQKMDEMTLFREEGLITTIPCFEMERIDVVSCNIINFKGCRSLMRSKLQIPETIFGKNGIGIVRVTTVDSEIILDYISPKDFSGLKKRKHVYNKNNYYTVDGNYLYLPDSELEVVSMSLFAMSKKDAEKVSSCSDNNDLCVNYMDEEFVCPDRFLDLVIKDTLTECSSFYMGATEDENPNLDIHQKTKTVN